MKCSCKKILLGDNKCSPEIGKKYETVRFYPETNVVTDENGVYLGQGHLLDGVLHITQEA